MIHGKILLVLSAVWIISEIALAKTKHFRSDQTRNLDRASLGILWTTISLAVTAGVIIGLRGIGLIRFHSSFISQVGIVLIVLGLVLRWTAVFTLKKYFTVNVAIVKDHQLVDTGVYRYIRHPAYAGSLLSFLGLGLSFANWLSTLVIFLPILVVFLYRIRVEEQALQEVFGKAYIQYANSTKRILPGIY
jgi:protein-S-isoprenylcysteine O-methyltransferase Ste14